MAFKTFIYPAVSIQTAPSAINYADGPNLVPVSKDTPLPVHEKKYYFEAGGKFFQDFSVEALPVIGKTIFTDKHDAYKVVNNSGSDFIFTAWGSEYPVAKGETCFFEFNVISTTDDEVSLHPILANNVTSGSIVITAFDKKEVP